MIIHANFIMSNFKVYLFFLLKSICISFQVGTQVFCKGGWERQVFKKFYSKLGSTFKLGGCFNNILFEVLICCILNYSRVLEEVKRCWMVIRLKLYIELSCSTTHGEDYTTFASIFIFFHFST